MKKSTFLILGLLVLTVTAVFAQAKPPKAQVIVDPSVPIDQSAILFFPKDSVVLMFNDTKFGLVGPVSVKNLAGKGGQNASQWKIANPILQVPAGKHTVVAAGQASLVNTPVGLKKVTCDFQPGRYYQMATVFNNVDNIKEATKKIYEEAFSKGLDWCFVDITDEVNAGKKDFEEKWRSLAKNGEMGKGQVIEPFVVTDDSAYAPLKPVKAKKIIDPRVPYEQSAFLYFDKEFQILKFNDITYKKIFGFTGDGKSKDSDAIIVKPIMQIPAGTQTVIASAEGKFNGKKITYNFLPGHHYQAVSVFEIDISKGMGSAMFGALKTGVTDQNKTKDWFFVDITNYLKAGLKNFSDLYTYYSYSGADKKNQPREDWYWIEIDYSGENPPVKVNK